MTMTKTDVTTERNCRESSEDLLLITAAAKSYDVQILHWVLFTHDISYCILLCGSLLLSLLFATVFDWGQEGCNWVI